MDYEFLLENLKKTIIKEFDAAMQQVGPIHTEAGRQALKRADCAISRYLNEARRQFEAYEDRTNELFRQENYQGLIPQELYRAFLRGLKAQIGLKKATLKVECLALALEVKKVDVERLASYN